MASLYGNQKRVTSLNKISSNNNGSLLDATTPNPYRTSGLFPSHEVVFANAVPLPSNFDRIKETLSYISNTNLPGTCFKSINSSVYSPIFLGVEGNPDQEFLYAKPSTYNPSDPIFGEVNSSNCEKLFIFANIQGMETQECNINLPSLDVAPIANTNGIIKVEQGCSPNIVVTQEFNVSSCGIGVNFISNVVEVDTWYNGQFNQLTTGNVGIGSLAWSKLNSTNILESIPERYTWQFGSIWFFKGLSNVIRKSQNNIDLNGFNDQYDNTSQLKPICVNSCILPPTNPINCSNGVDISKTQYSQSIDDNGLAVSINSPSNLFLNNALRQVYPSIIILDQDCQINLSTYIYDVSPLSIVDMNTILVSAGNDFVSQPISVCNINSISNVLMKEKGLFDTQSQIYDTNTVYYGKNKTYENYGRPIYTFLMKCFTTINCLKLSSINDGKVIVLSTNNCCLCSSSSSSSITPIT